MERVIGMPMLKMPKRTSPKITIGMLSKGAKYMIRRAIPCMTMENQSTWRFPNRLAAAGTKSDPTMPRSVGSVMISAIRVKEPRQ